MRNLPFSRSFEILASFLCLAILNIKGPAPSRIAVAPNTISVLADFDKTCDLGPSLIITKHGHEEKYCLLGTFSSVLSDIKKCDALRSD